MGDFGAAIEKSRKDHPSISDSAKMMDFFRQEVRTRHPLAEDPEAGQNLMKIVEMWGAFMGNEYEAQSLKNLWLDAGLEGGMLGLAINSFDKLPCTNSKLDNLFVAPTFKDILTGLLAQVANMATIQLGCEVTRISNRRSGVIDIEAADGFRGAFDNVIVTAPLGWLKRNEDVFSPLPAPRISNAIRSLGHRNLERAFIKFPKAFWNDGASETNICPVIIPKDTQSPLFPIESLP